MAKKTYKKNKRGKADILGNAGTALITLLVSAIVESVVERLLQQVFSHDINDDSNNLQDDSVVKEVRDPVRHNPIQTAMSKLRDNVGNAKLTRKELLQVVRSFAQDPTSNLTDVVATIQDVTRQAVQSSINNIGNEAEVAFEGVTNPLKNVTHVLDTDDTDTSDKKNKKKGKKKKKK